MPRHDQVRVTIIKIDGSSPRELGAYMVVMANDIDGTIGGGALEWQAIADARKMLDQDLARWHRASFSVALGPQLGQCCGGVVRLLFECLSREDDGIRDPTGAAVAVVPLDSGAAPVLVADRSKARTLPMTIARLVGHILSGTAPRQMQLMEPRSGGFWIEPAPSLATPLFLYGAGHVGRAVVAASRDLPFDLHWIDIDRQRFPDAIPAGVTSIPATDPTIIARAASQNAFHLVMTHSHALDLSICAAVLARGDFAYLGVIGSMTKRARFLSRLTQLCLGPMAHQHMHCPIGNGALSGKQPGVIAISILADLIQRVELRASQNGNIGAIPAMVGGN